jgi:hypothetical protein
MKVDVKSGSKVSKKLNSLETSDNKNKTSEGELRYLSDSLEILVCKSLAKWTCNETGKHEHRFPRNSK